MSHLEHLALAVREALCPGLSPAELLPLDGLFADQRIPTRVGHQIVRVLTHRSIPDHLYGLTTFEAEQGRAWIWLNRAAWPELHQAVPRTRFTVAHELGHVVLHGEEIIELMVRAEPDHKARLETEANRFAAHLLIPDGAMKRLQSRERTVDGVMRRFGVSFRTAAKRLEEWSA